MPGKLLRSYGLPGILLLALLPFLLLCFYNQPFIDDYGLANLVRAHGLWQAQSLLYHQLNGRFVTSFLLTALNPLSYGWQSGIRAATFFVNLLTLGTLAFSVKSLLRSAIGHLQLAILTVVVFLVFLAIIPDVTSVLYWFASQTTHHLASLFLVLIPVSVFRAHQARGRGARAGWLGLAAFGTFVVGGSGEVVTVLLGWLLLAAGGLSLWRREYRNAGLWAGLLLELGGTALLDIIAPGNLRRLHATTPGAGSLATKLHQFWHPGWLAKALKLLLWQPGTLLILVVPLLFYTLASQAIARRPAGVRLPLAFSSLVLLGGVFLGAFLMQLEIYTEEIVPRCANVLLWWLLLGWLAACWAALPAPAAPVTGPLRTARRLSILLLGGLILVPVGRAWRELLVEAPAWNQQCQSRYAFMRQVAQANPHATVEFAPIQGVTPQLILLRSWYDITSDYTWNYNREMAQYFGLDSVRVNPAARHATVR